MLSNCDTHLEHVVGVTLCKSHWFRLINLLDLHAFSCMSNFIVSILQSVILCHSDFEFEQVIAFEFSPLSYFQYNLRSISAMLSYFTWCQNRWI